MSLPAWIPIVGPISDRKRAWRELPELAARLGLQFTPSDHRYRLGEITGSFRGYPVQVSPDVPTVAVRCARALAPFRCSMLDVGAKRRDLGIGHPEFERRFPTAELTPAQAAALRARPELLDRVLALLRHRVSGITVSAGGLTCAMYNPYRFFAKNLRYITAADLERLLPEMVATVGLLEAVMPPE